MSSEGNVDFELQDCVFPVSTRATGDDCPYQIIPVFGHDRPPRPFGGEPNGYMRSLSASWAILLHFYLVRDTVSFRYTSNVGAAAAEPGKQHLFQDGDGKAEVLYFDVQDQHRLHEVRVVASKVLMPGDSPVNQMNTAVQLRRASMTASIDVGPIHFGPLSKGISASVSSLCCPSIQISDIILQSDKSCSDLRLCFREDRLSNLYASSVAASFRYIHQHVVDHGDLTVGQLHVLSAANKTTIQRWNPADPFSVEQSSCMHHLVEAKLQETPQASGIQAWDGSLSYIELSRLSDLAALKLRGAGVRRGAYVPFAYDKSLWAVVATLAILKAGGAFVPLNAGDPPARLAEICRSVAATVVVTAGPLVKVFKPIVAVVVDISSDTLSLSQCGDSANGVITSDPNVEEVNPADPIFVLFTSGSTGKPKGMIHTHASICTHAMTHGEAMGYHGKRVLQFAAHTFDVAIMDFFTTLLFGGCICIPSEEDRSSDIIGFINATAVDYAILTPSFAGLIEPCEVPTLKTLAIGGEALPQDRIKRWADRVRLIQIYGPAEVGICMAMEMRTTTRPDVVGYPLLNSTCWLVDPDNPERLVPIGAVGELVIAGPSLAQGYIGDKAKTRLSFVDAPAWAKGLDVPVGRVFKSGDLLKYDVGAMDGSYVFVGRKDSQIKLRGQRIEPGEVEYHIGQLPGVAIAMVTRPTAGCFAGELVAVVRLNHINGQKRHVENEPIRMASKQAPTIETLRDALSKTLPGYMIPTACLTIENFPNVPSLKIDRRKVDEWLALMVSSRGGSRLPTLTKLDIHEGTARALSIKVAEILDSRRLDQTITNHDFVLQQTGINSIQIISLSMHLLRCYGKKVPVDLLLNSSTTIRQLARSLDCQNSASIPKNLRLLDLDEEVTSIYSNLTKTLFQHQRLENERLIRNVLLTGATGYLGIWVLHRLLLNPSLCIHVIIRCPTPSDGLTQLVAVATTQGWWQEAFSTRVHVWSGDLRVSSLGLDDTQLGLITGAQCAPTDAIHAIIHSGARVHYSSDYHSLKAINVLAMIELLRLAAQAPHLSEFVFVSGGFKPSHHLGAADAAERDELHDVGGYAQTKYVCERVLEQCRQHAAFATKRLEIVKPGYIIGSSCNGFANRKDFIWRLIAGCVEIGAYNNDEAERWLFIAPADSVAGRIVNCLDLLGSKQSSDGGVERISSGLYFSDLWEVVQQTCGCRLEPLAGEEWMRILVEKVLDVGETHLLFPLLEVLERDGRNVGEKGIVGKGIAMREETKKVVKRNLEYLVESGFLPDCRSKTESTGG